MTWTPVRHGTRSVACLYELFRLLLCNCSAPHCNTSRPLFLADPIGLRSLGATKHESHYDRDWCGTEPKPNPRPFACMLKAGIVDKSGVYVAGKRPTKGPGDSYRKHMSSPPSTRRPRRSPPSVDDRVPPGRSERRFRIQHTNHGTTTPRPGRGEQHNRRNVPICGFVFSLDRLGALHCGGRGVSTTNERTNERPFGAARLFFIMMLGPLLAACWRADTTHKLPLLAV